MYKILIVGGFVYPIYEEAIYSGFKKLGYEVDKFSFYSPFKGYPFKNISNIKNFSKIEDIYYRFQNKFLFGPTLFKLNQDLKIKVKNNKYDMILFHRATHIFPSTLEYIKQNSNAKLISYNNDDPFTDKLPKYYWRHFIKGLKYYDWNFVYREKNIIDYKNIDLTNVFLLRSYYIKENNFHIPNIEKKYNVIFIGHWENDGRDEVIKYLIDNNINMQLFGIEWHRSKYYDYFIKRIGEIKPLYGEDYNKTINQAKIALVFLSKLNNDTYTRRCFEIPATKTMMMSEYTDDLANNLFEENKEAVYFRNKEELLEKIKYYSVNKDKIKEIGENGYKRLMKDGHEVVNRCKEIIKVYKGLN